jgi:LPXTG-motif cell wall-anchored protein
MKRLSVLIFVLLALPATAHAGGWATVGLSSTPEGTPPGGTWTVDLTVLQHGRTPLAAVEPAVIVNGKRYDALPTGKPGVYRAEVKLGGPGTYRYTVDDGFGNAFPQTYPPVEIRGAAAPATGSDTPWWPFALAGLLCAGAALLLRRSRPAQPQVAAPSA